MRTKHEHDVGLPGGVDWADLACNLRPRRMDTIETHLVDGGSLLYDRATARVFQLTETARDVWIACDGKSTVNDIARGITDVFEVEHEVVLPHIEELLAYFAANNLINSVEYDV